MLRHALLVLTSLSLVACSSGYQSTVTYTVKVKDEDISGTTIAGDDDIETTDAQWQAFLNAARAELGETPQEFEIDRARIQLDVTQAKNVGRLEEVFTGEGALFLRANNGVQVDIATFEDPKGTAQMEVDLTGKDLEEVNAAMLASDFDIGLRSPTTRASTTDFEAPIIITLDVVAH